MQPDLIDLIASEAAIVALLGKASDGEPALGWNYIPQGQEQPSIALYLISGTPSYHMAGQDEMVPYRVQMDCRALDYLTADRVARALKRRLSGYRGTHGGTRFGGIFIAAERHLSLNAAADEMWHRVSIDFIVQAASA